MSNARVIFTILVAACGVLGLALEAEGARKLQPKEAEKGFLFIEAEDFPELGNWQIDTQFTHKMGSAYLICPGANKPTEKPAKASVEIPRAAKWRIWARTKDWVPEFSPGKFTVEVNGKAGAVLGASKKGWGWEKVGDFELPKGVSELVLKDLSGAYARCDALLFTTDMGFDPDKEDEAKLRMRLKGEDCEVAEGGEFDIVVVGAGPGGMGASIAAARNGAKVGLVFDRPILGGNSSEEVGVGYDGAAHHAKNARESGIAEELRLTKRYINIAFGFNTALDRIVSGCPNLSRFANERVLRVERNDKEISAVISRNTITGKWTRWRAKIFVDSTGDGWIAYFAGARTMYGREGASEFNEDFIAPKVGDKLTMRGTLRTSMSVYVGTPTEYVTPEWANVMPEGFDRKVNAVTRPWWLEAPSRIDDIEDPEEARDYTIRINFAYFGWLRYKWPGGKQAQIEKYTFSPPSIINGRREGMRVVGDYVVTANDCKEGKVFEDAISYGGWALDTHDPQGMDNPHGDGWCHPHIAVPIYTIPYRSLYSADIPNLFLASRCVSCTHWALGSMRVQGTVMEFSQAAGTAAAMCCKKGILPREFGKKHIGELRRQLLKDDMYIPTFSNDDPDDLARKARVSATSFDEKVKGAKPENAIDGVARPIEDVYHGWKSDPKAAFPQRISIEFDKPEMISEVRLTFDSNLTPMRVKPRMPEELVREYVVEACCNGTWVKVAEEADNYLRHRVHSFESVRATALRVIAKSTWGDKSARIFEVRAYSEASRR